MYSLFHYHHELFVHLWQLQKIQDVVGTLLVLRLPHFFQEGRKVKPAGSIKVLETVVKALDRPGGTGEAVSCSAGLGSSPQGRRDPGVAKSELS